MDKDCELGAVLWDHRIYFRSLCSLWVHLESNRGKLEGLGLFGGGIGSYSQGNKACYTGH